MQKQPYGKNSESRFLIGTAVLVAFVGIPSFISLLKEPSSSAILSSRVEHVESTGVRVPASVGERVVDATTVGSTAMTAYLDCNDLEPKIVTDANQIRLITSNCGKAADVEVTNSTNGYTASVFNQERGFTTDYLDLSSGNNEMVIKSKDKTLKFVVSKRLPASAANQNE